MITYLKSASIIWKCCLSDGSACLSVALIWLRSVSLIKLLNNFMYSLICIIIIIISAIFFAYTFFRFLNSAPNWNDFISLLNWTRLFPLLSSAPPSRRLQIFVNFGSKNMFYILLKLIFNFSPFIYFNRLECYHTFKGIEMNIIMLFQYLEKFAPKLERLVLHGHTPLLTDDICWESQIDLGQQLIDFLSKMKFLVAFSFTGYNIQPVVQDAVHGHAAAEILPGRPSFWLHLGKSLPKANDPSEPAKTP